MQILRLHVKHEVGLHARPAAAFVQCANRYQAQVKVRNLTLDSDWANAKSILSVLALGVEKDHLIELQAMGEDEAAVLAALLQLVEVTA